MNNLPSILYRRRLTTFACALRVGWCSSGSVGVAHARHDHAFVLLATRETLHPPHPSALPGSCQLGSCTRGWASRSVLWRASSGTHSLELGDGLLDLVLRGARELVHLGAVLVVLPC